MSTLHLLNKGAIEHPATQDCLRSLDKKNDGLLLMEDGVYLTLKNAIDYQAKNVFALQHDLHLRGLSVAANHIKIVDDNGFVELCTQYDKVVSWF